MNMAIDDALLASVTPDCGPTLRFYRWAEPTLSLGYFQAIATVTAHLSSENLKLVRRASGGGAIIHDHELTYSLVLPAGSHSSRGAATDIYQAVHTAFIDCLAGFGVSAQRFGNTGRVAKSDDSFLCFQRRNVEDLVIAGYKVLGSAQRRGPSGLLQHGSLLLATSTAAPELPGISELTSRGIEIDCLVEQLASKLAAVCGVKWKSGKLSAGELSAAKISLEEKFSALTWTAKR
jgi:lipoate-protein ligase A